MTRVETVLIVHRDGEVLLGMKNPEKFGGGKWNGFGGSIEPGETLEETAIREALEEGFITPISPKKIGNILFKFETEEQDHNVHFYKVESYEGEIRESNEMIRYQWFPENSLPLDNMWPADRHWLPYFIRGEMFKGVVHFNKDFEVSHHEINSVDNLLD